MLHAPRHLHLLAESRRARTDMSELYPQESIAGRTALVTGATSGIGAATAWRLAEAKCQLILCARRADRLEALRTDLQKRYAVTVHCLTRDLSDARVVQTLLDDLPESFRQVDILVNNAGLALGTAGVHENDMQDSIKMIETNITAVAQLTRLFVPGMVERDRGHVVNISSIAAHCTYPGGSIYCGTKHFVDAFTNAARHDLVNSQIRVTSISPGAVQTEFSRVRYKGDEAKAAAVYEGITPLNADDCADSVLFALTRPPHVQIGEIILYATYQSSPQSMGRQGSTMRQTK